MDEEREIQIEYERFIRDVNDYAMKRAEEANTALKQKGIDAIINYALYEKNSESFLEKIKSFFMRIWNNNP